MEGTQVYPYYNQERGWKPPITASPPSNVLKNRLSCGAIQAGDWAALVTLLFIDVSDESPDGFCSGKEQAQSHY